LTEILDKDKGQIYFYLSWTYF